MSLLPLLCGNKTKTANVRTYVQFRGMLFMREVVEKRYHGIIAKI